jgi:hypothetical protein
MIASCAFTANRDGDIPRAGLDAEAAYILDGTTTSGGATSDGAVFELSEAGS